MKPLVFSCIKLKNSCQKRSILRVVNFHQIIFRKFSTKSFNIFVFISDFSTSASDTTSSIFDKLVSIGHFSETCKTDKSLSSLQMTQTWYTDIRLFPNFKVPGSMQPSWVVLAGRMNFKINRMTAECCISCHKRFRLKYNSDKFNYLILTLDLQQIGSLMWTCGSSIDSITNLHLKQVYQRKKRLVFACWATNSFFQYHVFLNFIDELSTNKRF